MAIMLSQHFSQEELTASDIAIAHHIANTPTPAHLINIKTFLVPGLEKVRALCGNVPLILTNAYRNPAVNKLAGGTPTSAHQLGFAADGNRKEWGSETFARAIALAMRAHSNEVGIDQLIWESGRNVVHMSFDPRKKQEGKPRGMMGRQPKGPGTPIDWSYFSK